MSVPIHILNLSSLTHAEIEAVARQVHEVFGVPVQTSHFHIDLDRAYDVSRRQYNSTVLLSQLLSLEKTPIRKLIAVVDVDLFIPVLTFVFGEAQLDGIAAIVSMYRLTNTFYGVEEHRSLLLERVAKEVIHELGHTFGMYHCHQFECVMRSSTYVEEIDLKKETLCEECAEIFYKKMR